MELKFIPFKQIVETHGVPKPGRYIMHKYNLEVETTLIDWWDNDDDDMKLTMEFWGDKKFLCLDGRIVPLEEVITSSGIEIKYAKVMS